MTESLSNEHCQTCLKPLSAKGSGFITQFLEICNCRLLADSEQTVLEICAECRKPVGSRRPGSFTQYIFKDGQCACDRPVLPASEKNPRENQIGNSAQRSDNSSKAPEPELELSPEEFPLERYKPISILGSGASGKVYLSRDRVLHKKVAIKVLHQVTASQSIQFQEEARATSKLNHPNIVKILDFGATSGGRPFMVLEYISGISLQELLRKHGPLPSRLMISIAQKLCSALSHSHSNGIYHRDLKPSNILLFDKDAFRDKASGSELDLRVIDFGIAGVKESTSTNAEFQGKTLAGTPAYMPPDIVNGYSYTASSEVYSLGCLFFEMLTGRPPYHGETALETISAHINAPVPSLLETIDEVDREDLALVRLDGIIAICLSKNPQDRYASIDLLSEEISGGISSEISPDPGDIDDRSSTQATAKEKKILVGGLISCLIAGLLFSSIEFHSKTRKSPIAKSIGNIPGHQLDASSKAPVVLTDDLIDGLDQAAIEANRGNLPKSVKARNSLYSKPEVTEIDADFITLNQPTRIDLKYNTLNDATMKKISRNSELKVLELDGSDGISPQSLEDICQLPELHTLSLSDCNLSDEHLRAIGANRDLRILRIRKNPDISLKGLTYLRRPANRPLMVYVQETFVDKLDKAERRKLENELNLEFRYPLIEPILEY